MGKFVYYVVLAAFLFSVFIFYINPNKLSAEEGDVVQGIKVPLGLDADFAYIPKDNPQTKEKVELGKLLYFDVRLSENNTIACATCHSPKMGFTDNQPVSMGIGTLKGGRSAPTPEISSPPMPLLEDAWVKAYDTSEEDYYTQAGDLFRLMNEDQKKQLTNNIAEGLVQASESVQKRMLNQFANADSDYAARVERAIKKLT